MKLETQGANLIALAAVDELDGAANILKRYPQVGDIVAVIMDAFDFVLVRQLHNFARHEVEADDRALDADK